MKLYVMMSPPASCNVPSYVTIIIFKFETQFNFRVQNLGQEYLYCTHS
jgi:hypothetical protein